MTIETDLRDRAEGKCELCGSTNDLSVLAVSGAPSDDADGSILVCLACKSKIEEPGTEDVHHWRCLNDSMWNPVPAVQVTAWRMLNRLSSEGWAQDALGMLYLEDDVMAWAQAESGSGDDADTIVHKDCHGAVLAAGDTVTLIKDLNVRGAGFTAKRGTAVRNISLVPDNAGQIEGRVSGQQIVILTEFVKKSS